MTQEEMQKKIDSGEAIYLGWVGVQKRPVYQIGERVFEKAIYFNDGFDHSDFYQVSSARAEELKACLVLPD